MKNPLISVIVPVYKAEEYLNRCVESLVNQTYKELEIFLVDDGSPDNCPAICDKWENNDSRIKVLHLENGGVANARNSALKQASGDFIAFADSDDYLEPDMYERLVEIIKSTDADIAVCDYQINDESRGENATKILSYEDVMKRIAKGDYKYGVLWNKLYKKSVVNGIEMPVLRCSQDLPYNYFAFKNSAVIAESDLKLYHYYQNENSTVHKRFSRMKYDAVRAREIILADAPAELREFALYGYILSLFVFLNSIIETGECTDMTDDVRKEILKYKAEVRKSSAFSKKDKLKIQLLSVSFIAYKTAFSKLG